ncbi:MAG: hypothetical protein HY842_16430 [Bacteroidetes bacterium]|nr:hypothetical protein [Bacteroidota bacterium]
MLTKNELKQLIVEGKIKEAVEALQELTKNDADLQNEVVQQAALLGDLEKQKRTGTINFESAQIAQAKIQQSLLEIIDQLFEGSKKQPAPKRRFRYAWAIGGLATAMAILGGIAEFSGYSLRDVFGGNSQNNGEPFNVTVFVHGKEGRQDMILRQQGEVIMDLGGERRSEPIRENGQAFFLNLPPSYSGKGVSLNVDFSEPYKSIHPDSLHPLKPGEAIYLPVELQGLERIYGTAIWQEKPLPGVVVSIVGSSLTDTTDASGAYEIFIPEGKERRKVQEVKFWKQGFKLRMKNATPQIQESLDVIMEK